ncbi:ferredoxin [Nanoarchaeota archaeon]
MTKYKVEHDKPNCIGCGACAAVCPESWEMVEDGKSKLKGAKEGENQIETKEIEDAEFDSNKEAADSCPVNVIHIINTESGEKLI